MAEFSFTLTADSKSSHDIIVRLKVVRQNQPVKLEGQTSVTENFKNMCIKNCHQMAEICSF